jgi:MFS family permease
MRDRAQVVYAIVFLDLVMMFALIPLLPDYQSQYGLTKPQAGLVVSAYSITVLALSFPVGWLADRVGPRRLTIAGVALMAVATPAYAFGSGFWSLMAARGVQGAASAISWTAALAWLMSVNPPDQRGRVLGTATGFGSAGILIGPVFGGVVGSLFGIRAPFVILGIAAGVVAVLALFTSTPPRTAFEPASLTAVLRRGFGERAIVVAAVLIFVAAVVGGTIETLVPLHLGHDGYSAAWITVVLTISGALSVVTNRVAGELSDRVSKRLIALYACAGTLAGLVLLAVMPNALGIAIVFIALTPAISGLYTVGYPLSAIGADRSSLGHSSVFGLINVVWGAGFVVGPAAMAAVAAASSDPVAYVILVIFTLGAGEYLRRLALDW